MSAAVQQCPKDPIGPEDICARLAREINEMINRDKRQFNDCGTHGLVQRFREQINGASGPGTDGWRTHDEAIKNQQRGLRNRLDEFNRNNCGSKIPIPQDAWQWATRPAPQPKEWMGQPVKREVSSEGGLLKYFENATGLTGVALLIYIVVSEGSRAFPPRNLVPVP
jgi:hypothetical protein